MIRRIPLSLAPAMAVLFCALGYSQPGAGWEYLGDAHVDGALDHDRIVVTAAKGAFRAIRFRVENSAIVFDRIVVHYGDGQMAPVVVRRRIPAGEWTRVIDLPGRRRVIESIEFWYQRGNWATLQRPKLVLFGLH